MVVAVAIEDDAAAASAVAVALHVTLIVVAVAFPVQLMDRKTLISVNSVPRIVFLLKWVSAGGCESVKLKSQ